MTVVVGLDLSLTRTGVARIEGIAGPNVVNLADGSRAWSPRVNVRSVTSKVGESTTGARSLRLRKIAGEVYTLAAAADLIVVEGPSFASSGAGTWDRAGLWWLVVARLTGTGRQVVEVPPSNLKMYALGKGGGKGAGKDDVITAVVRRYPDVEFSGNDEADALVLAAMGARFAGIPIDDVPQSHLRAMSGVKWQPTT